MQIRKFMRKEFPVDGVQVTDENMSEVAEWCHGMIQSRPNVGRPGERRYIKVQVDNPKTERQTEAYVGDWVLFAGKGFKVYRDQALWNNFYETDSGDAEDVYATHPDGEPEPARNVFLPPTPGIDIPCGGTTATANPGGTHG